MASVRIIYATMGGNTQLVAEQVCLLLEAAGHKAEIKRVEQSKVSDLQGADLVILAAPTYGVGVIQEYFDPFLAELKKTDLKGQNCAVISLGDPRYEAQYHCETAAILEEAIKAAGGTLAAVALKISGSPVRHLEGLVKKWAEDLAKKL